MRTVIGGITQTQSTEGQKMPPVWITIAGKKAIFDDAMLQRNANYCGRGNDFGDEPKGDNATLQLVRRREKICNSKKLQSYELRWKIIAAQMYTRSC